MKVELIQDRNGYRYWLASGYKHGRATLVEADTRKEAVRHWCSNWNRVPILRRAK